MFVRSITLCLCLLLPSMAQALTLITSIKPIQMIAYELTLGVTQPQVLLSGNSSPHDYALRPSDVKRLHDADLVVWYGDDLEPFLTKVLRDNTNTVTISALPGLSLREFDSSDEDHDGHHHGHYDPHFWLGMTPTIQVATALSRRLAEIDPDNAAQYQLNLENFQQRQQQLQQALAKQLQPLQQQGYYVFHDAYGYFEQQYQLRNLGHFTVTPDRKPGAKTLIAIRKALTSHQVQCVFAEPQFTPAVIDSVMRGSQAQVGQLDPIGTDIPVGKDSYFQFLQAMADSFSQCLTPR